MRSLSFKTTFNWNNGNYYIHVKWRRGKLCKSCTFVITPRSHSEILRWRMEHLALRKWNCSIITQQIQELCKSPCEISKFNAFQFPVGSPVKRLLKDTAKFIRSAIVAEISKHFLPSSRSEVLTSGWTVPPYYVFCNPWASANKDIQIETYVPLYQEWGQPTSARHQTSK